MTLNEIQTLVEKVSGYEINHDRAFDKITSRYVFSVIAIEENHRVVEIAAHLSQTRFAVYKMLKVADLLLSYNQPFKKLYLGCIAEIAKNER